MKTPKITLTPLEQDDREQFILDNQYAFKFGAVEEFGLRDDHFDDDGEISKDASGYVARAAALGIIRGSGGKFRPKDPVTRAEAAVILNAIVGAEESDAVAVFADSSAVPVWARPSLSALTTAGIFSGTGDGAIDANGTLTRAQVAELLLRVRRNYC